MGQVQGLKNGKVKISFLEKLDNEKSRFRWPKHREIANVAANYIFQVEGQGLNLFEDPRILDVKQLYEAFKEKYFS